MIFGKREPRKIILHIGLPKTASTALQMQLFEQRELLREKNVLYSENVNRPDDPKHNFLLNTMRKGENLPLMNEAGFKKYRRIIISNEAISNEFYLQGVEANKRLANRLKQLGDLEVCVVIREPQSWLKSYYKQAVINQMVNKKPYYQTSLTIDEFRRIEPVEKMLDQASFLTDISNCYQAPVRIFSFENTTVSEIANYCAGFTLGSVAVHKHRNESLPDVAVEVMRQLNKGISTLAEKYAWSYLLQRSLVSDHDVLNTLASRAAPDDIAALDISKLDHISLDVSQSMLVNDDDLQDLIDNLRHSYGHYSDSSFKEYLH